MITIEDYLLEIYDDFKEYVENTEDLCLLTDLHYQAGQVPDYNNIHIQQLYLLRYIFSYAFEYKRMFIRVLEKATYQNDISLTSIGCGNMIDYWSLVEALTELGDSGVSVKYTGIDLIDWNYKIKQRGIDDVEFKQGYASETFAKSDVQYSDLYIFPKSISEFDDEEFERICDVLRGHRFLKDEIFILISLRSSDGSMYRDMCRSQKIITAMTQNGFKTKDSARTYSAFDDEERGIRGIDCTFEYPDEAKELLRTLAMKCNNFEECDQNCETYLNRWPILTLRNVSFQILTFRRED